jgi:hypothetical protein
VNVKSNVSFRVIRSPLVIQTHIAPGGLRLEREVEQDLMFAGHAATPEATHCIRRG